MCWILTVFEYAEYAEYKDSQVQHITLFLYSEFHEENLNHQETTSEWTQNDKIKHTDKEEKSNYIIFSKARQEFAARLTLNEKLLERKKVTKIDGVLLEEKGG